MPLAQPFIMLMPTISRITVDGELMLKNPLTLLRMLLAALRAALTTLPIPLIMPCPMPDKMSIPTLIQLVLLIVSITLLTIRPAADTISGRLSMMPDTIDNSISTPFATISGRLSVTDCKNADTASTADAIISGKLSTIPFTKLATISMPFCKNSGRLSASACTAPVIRSVTPCKSCGVLSTIPCSRLRTISTPACRISGSASPSCDKMSPMVSVNLPIISCNASPIVISPLDTAVTSPVNHSTKLVICAPMAEKSNALAICASTPSNCAPAVCMAVNIGPIAAASAEAFCW